ncbi:MAG TPA: phosphate ABC transporter permease subunit PstC [Acidimicrobiia bacterium]|jgi:phosphate transport system permease protein|nr:phosphate ABC transporter permease subunit PstC [Acidimicrobiia bacterium]
MRTEQDMARMLRGNPRRRRREAIVRTLFFLAAALSIVVSVAIVLSVVIDAVEFLSAIDLNQLWADGWFPRRGRFSIPTIFVGSLMITLVALVVALPLGLGAAIYLSEYARPGVRRALKPTLEILAGVPSVVLGFFALSFITPNIMQAIWQDTQVFNYGAAGIAVGILIIPLIASVAEDAMRAVPQSLREASYGLGAKRWHTSLRVIFPAALSGIVAAVILGFARALGETMVVAIAAGASGGALLNVDITQGGTTMTAAMASLAIGSDQVAGDSSAFQSLFFVGLLLFLMTLGLNVLSERLVRRFRQKY